MGERQTQVAPLGDSELELGALLYRTPCPLSVRVDGACLGGTGFGIMFRRGVVPGRKGEKAWM